MSQPEPPETSSDGSPELRAGEPAAAPRTPTTPLIQRWWRSRPLAIQLAVAVLTVLSAVPLLLYIADAGWSQREGEIAARQDALRRAELAATRLGRAMANMQSGARAFLVTGDSTFLGAYELGLRQLDGDLDSLRRLLGPEPGTDDAARLAEFNLAVERWAAPSAAQRERLAGGDAAACRADRPPDER